LINEPLFLRLGLSAELSKFFSRLKAIICPALLKQLPDVFIVSFSSLGLKIWRVWAANFGAFVPGYTQPAKVIDYLLGCGRGIAFEVGIFDAQDEFAS
jgi:hypothetical protein